MPGWGWSPGRSRIQQRRRRREQPRVHGSCRQWANGTATGGGTGGPGFGSNAGAGGGGGGAGLVGGGGGAGAARRTARAAAPAVAEAQASASCPRAATRPPQPGRRSSRSLTRCPTGARRRLRRATGIGENPPADSTPPSDSTPQPPPATCTVPVVADGTPRTLGTTSIILANAGCATGKVDPNPITLKADEPYIVWAQKPGPDTTAHRGRRSTSTSSRCSGTRPSRGWRRPTRSRRRC